MSIDAYECFYILVLVVLALRRYIRISRLVSVVSVLVVIYYAPRSQSKNGSSGKIINVSKHPRVEKIRGLSLCPWEVRPFEARVGSGRSPGISPFSRCVYFDCHISTRSREEARQQKHRLELLILIAINTNSY